MSEQTEAVEVTIRNTSRTRGTHTLTDVIAGSVEFKAGAVKTIKVSPACAAELESGKLGDFDVLEGRQAERALAAQRDADAKAKKAEKAAEAARQAAIEAEKARFNDDDDRGDDEPEQEVTDEDVKSFPTDEIDDEKRAVAARVKLKNRK